MLPIFSEIGLSEKQGVIQEWPILFTLRPSSYKMYINFHRYYVKPTLKAQAIMIRVIAYLLVYLASLGLLWRRVRRTSCVLRPILGIYVNLLRMGLGVR
jgi:Na+-translocating ferredoxin:NAD+ oxidoreductase RnfA subunit